MIENDQLSILLHGSAHDKLYLNLLVLLNLNHWSVD